MLTRRRTRDCCRYAAIAALSLFGVVRDALAEDPSPSLRFRVLVEETGCPNDTFALQVLRRVPSAKLAAPNEPALSMQVRLSTEPGIVRGRLTLQESNGFVTERDVTGASCAEVTAALALIAAVFLDPNATADQPPKVPPRAEPQPDSAEARGVWRVGVGPAVGVHGATAPRFTPGLALVVQAALERDRGLSPLFSVSLMRGLTSRVEVQTSVATLRFTAARLQACPVAWPRAGNLRFRPCGLIEAGVLDAAGTETSDPQRVRAPWLAPGGALRAELNLSTILMISLDAGFVVPLFRPEFYFDPDAPETVAFEVPPTGSTGHLGLLARFE